MYDHRNSENTASLHRQGLYLETETDHGAYEPMVHDMLSLSANPALTPDMPAALFHVPPVAGRGSLLSLSHRRS